VYYQQCTNNLFAVISWAGTQRLDTSRPSYL